MPDNEPYSYEDRMQERYVYLLCEPLLPESKTHKIFKPRCYIGESKNPIKRYKKHLNTSIRGYPKKNKWINELRSLTGEKPRLKILESVVSTYTPGDSMKIEKAWLWAASLVGYDLTNPSWRYFLTHDVELLSHKFIEPIRKRAQFLTKIHKRPLGIIKTHDFSMESINPIYGFTLVTNDGKFINCSSKEKRAKLFKTHSHATKEWSIPKNQKQYEEHSNIFSDKGIKRHPKDLAGWKARPIFKNANSWEELKEGLWEWRWSIHRVPRGGVLFDGKYPLRLKKIRTEFSLARLEIRFGQEFIDYDPRDLSS